jgi:hypothetical protein
VLTELQKRLWSRGYFGYGERLAGFEYERRPGWTAVVVKLAIPFVAGFLGAIASESDLALVGGLVAYFGSLALTWPVFLTFDAIPTYVKHRVFELRSIYALSAVAGAGLGALGGTTLGVIRSLVSAPSFDDWIESIGVNHLPLERRGRRIGNGQVRVVLRLAAIAADRHRSALVASEVIARAIGGVAPGGDPVPSIAIAYSGELPSGGRPGTYESALRSVVMGLRLSCTAQCEQSTGPPRRGSAASAARPNPSSRRIPQTLP